MAEAEATVAAKQAELKEGMDMLVVRPEGALVSLNILELVNSLNVADSDIAPLSAE